MDNVIFELQFLFKMALEPEVNNVVDLYSPDMETELWGMDVNRFRRERDRLGRSKSWSKSQLTGHIANQVSRDLFPRAQHTPVATYKNITDDQISVLMELMNFVLLHAKSLEGDVFIYSYVHLLVQLMVVLLASNQNAECKAWIRENFSELVTLKTNTGSSILHHMTNMDRSIGRFPIVPLVRLLVEDCKMDVNVEDNRRATPLHWLSSSAARHVDLCRRKPTKDMIRIAELLIDNGAHMDSVDNKGKEASCFFSKTFPKWSFNFSLKCLAARALLKHGVRYELQLDMPATVITFIESHKVTPLQQCENDENAPFNIYES